MTCKTCGGNRTPDHCNLCEMFAGSTPSNGTPTQGWPMVSEALAVHPDQREEAQARAKRHGVNVTYQRNGNVVIPDRNERRKLLRLEGFHDRSSFLGY